MCVDYRDLNKASPKDNFPLPHIDTLVDNTAGYSLFSFIDGFSGYNQIRMYPEDMEKITFIMIWGTFCFQKTVKGSAIADFLASRALEDYEQLNFDLPNEDLMCVATAENEFRENVLVSPDGEHSPFTSKLDFDCTNNMVEYEACIIGIRTAIERKIKVLEVYEDSALVIYQLKGEWKARDSKLINYRKLVLELIEEFEDITLCYLPRDENQLADALATLASMIKNREYPGQATENEKRTLRRLANDYVLDGEILYRRGAKMRGCCRGQANLGRGP
ncbi:uncharacterized protein [Gossypium hirsutum]|uniref:RNase H type-1 domain-containing protein n=1 Tax=Gossypium hirsutum TaxID=3635 RepID=A0ABM2ZKI1_GOSHI|nr:uncharacterized protein LOC107921735 [Gossypium hirsutum]